MRSLEDEVPFDIPDSWEWVRFSSIIELQSGQDMTPDKYNANGLGIPYITGASNIENGEVSDLKAGVTAHDKTGAVIEGTCEYDVDSSDATAVAAEVIEGKTFAARGRVSTGTMPNKGAVSGSIAAADEEYSVPMGFHDGSGKVSIAAVERAKIIPANIKSGIEILGVTGSYGGDEVTAQGKTVTPSFSEQTVLPDEGYDYLSQVTVAAIPITEIENSAGGITLTIGG